jgi:hypothetical protein
MAKNKTIETEYSVTDYIEAIKDDQRRKDCLAIISLITKKTNLEPKMWGTGIVGFGIYHYKYESGHEGSAPLVAIASRTNAITLYLSDYEKREELLAKFGKHKTGKGCVYIQNLANIDIDNLTIMIKKTIELRKLQNIN